MVGGNAGDDWLYADQGADKLFGGADNDAVSFQRSTAGVTVDLVQAVLNTGDAKGDSYEGIEHYEGGRDTLRGGDGDDALTGGAGIDSFVRSADEAGKDKITDFTRGEDILKFEDVLDGAGNDVQHLVEAGFTALAAGSTLTITWNDDASQVQIRGWTGGISATSPSSGKASAPRWWPVLSPSRNAKSPMIP